MFKDRINEALRKQLNISQVDLLIPPDPEMGDYAFPCFLLSKEKRKSPVEIAREIASSLPGIEGIERIKADGPYVNFFVSCADLAKNTIPRILSEKERYGERGRRDIRVMVEFSQANTHKAFHVGHVRGTSLGEALSRVLRKAGYPVVQVNYQGDTGAHVAKWLWCYKKFHFGSPLPSKDQEEWIADIYVEAVKRLAENADLQTEVDLVNRMLEERSDPELVSLWEKTRQWSLDSLESIYRDLDVHFDEYFFEGKMEEKAKEISERLVASGIAKVDNGATIMDLEAEGLGIWVLLRKDGTTLYSSKDLALAERKFNEFGIDRSIYVVGAAQSLHFKQLFATLRRAGFQKVDRCEHLAFSEVRLPEGKMSSRTGENILYSKLKRTVLLATTEEVKKRHPEWDEAAIDESAFNIAIAAIKFGMLSQDPNKTIVFDIAKAIDFEGETGPYIQYAHARICSILRKHGEVDLDADFGLITSPEEKKLLIKLARFGEVIEEVQSNMRVNALAMYSLTLAQDFNEFYHKHKVLSDDERLTAARACLIFAVRQTLWNALYLLAIPRPERM